MSAAGEQAKFVEGNLLRHVAVMSLSASVGLMAIFVVDLINMVYISWLGDPDLTAAIGYAGAVMFFTTAIGIGLSIGVTVLVAQAVGARDADLARQRATVGLLAGGGLGAVFTAVVWFFLPWIVDLLGATGRTAEETLAFWLSGFWGAPGVLIGQAAGGVVFGLLAVWLALRTIERAAAQPGL